MHLCIAGHFAVVTERAGGGAIGFCVWVAREGLDQAVQAHLNAQEVAGWCLGWCLSR